MINFSFKEGVFPDELKIARVMLLFKAGSSVDVNNYSPISILSFFSKIFERLAYIHITNLINKHNLLYKHQFGFRQKHSTHHALVIMIDNITKSLDQGNMVAEVFLDLSKAFDNSTNSSYY